MSVEPTAATSTGPAISVPAPLVPTDHITVDHISAREIAEFLRHLAELRRDAGGDPGARDVFLARKAELLRRLAAEPAHSATPLAPERRAP